MQVRHCVDESGEEFTNWIKMTKDGIYPLPNTAFYDVSAQKRVKKKNVVRRQAFRLLFGHGKVQRQQVLHLQILNKLI